MEIFKGVLLMAGLFLMSGTDSSLWCGACGVALLAVFAWITSKGKEGNKYGKL